MSTPVTGISSMATRLVLAELLVAYQVQSGLAVAIESVGGVDAAKRVQAGERLDVVLLAADAIERLLASGHLHAGSRVDLMRSPVAMAVKAGAPVPDVSNAAAVRQAVLAARSVGLSTGPSGVQLTRQFEAWGMAQDIQARLVQSPPGVPVGSLVASGEVELGFQQLSELLHLQGIAVLGPMPQAVQITTVFSAGLCTASADAKSVQRLLEFMASPGTAELKRRQGMEPA